LASDDAQNESQVEAITDPIKTMANSFMIEFRFMGEVRFANVFTQQSGADIHVHVINLHTQHQQKIILKRTQEGLALSADSAPIADDLLCTIITALNHHLQN